MELKLIGLGLFFWFIFGLYRLYELKIFSFGNPTITQTAAGPGATNIHIPKVNLNLPIYETTVTDGTWEISHDGASHWNNSANPGGNGNIVIYGHNKNNLFGPIRWLNINDEINLTNSQNQIFTYKVSETLTVSPNQTQFVLPKDEETLTLYTCTGLFDRNRFLVVAKPI